MMSLEDLQMDYQFKDVYDFQEKYPTKEKREEVLLTLDYDEIMHLARSCGNVTGGAYYSKFARMAKERENEQS